MASYMLTFILGTIYRTVIKFVSVEVIKSVLGTSCRTVIKSTLGTSCTTVIKKHIRDNVEQSCLGYNGDEDVPLVEFTYLVFTRVPGESYRKRLGSLLLCLCDVFRALINSLVCWSSDRNHDDNIDWLTDWLTDCLIDWLSDCFYTTPFSVLEQTRCAHNSVLSECWLVLSVCVILRTFGMD